MGALIGYGGVVVFLAIAVLAMVVLGRRRRPAHSDASREEPAQSDDTAATGYVPGVWMLGGAESAAPVHHAHGPHHGVDAGGSHGADAGGGTGDSSGSDGGGGD
jgi:uncharacterized protein (TIGR03382 family)